MNKQGSALVTVLGVTTVLMIIGLLAMQVIAADSMFARNDSDQAVALQLAEGGLDYGIERIIQAVDKDIIAGTYNIDGITVEIEDRGINRYLITSTGTKGSATRSVHLELLHTPLFGHSLFVGDTQAGLSLRNVTFEGPVHIWSPEVEINANNVVFESGVHFENENVKITGSHNFHVGVGYEDTYGYTGIDPPDVNIEMLEYLAENNTSYNNKNSTTVDFSQLKPFNYFYGDVTITRNSTVNTAPEGVIGSDYIIIATPGSVKFSRGRTIHDFHSQLVVLAGGDIVGEHNDSEEDVRNIHLPLYFYSKGNVYVSNNMQNIRSVIALGEFRLGQGNEEWEFYRFSALDIPGLQEAWGAYFIVNRWIN